MRKYLLFIIFLFILFNTGCNNKQIDLKDNDVDNLSIVENENNTLKTEKNDLEKVINETEYHVFNDVKEASFVAYAGGVSVIENETFLRMTLVLDPSKDLRIKRCVLNIKIGDTEKAIVYVPDSIRDDLLIPENNEKKMIKIPDKTLYENIEYKITNIEYK